MSLLNGIAAFGGDLSALASQAAKDATTPGALLNSVTPPAAADAPVAPDAATPPASVPAGPAAAVPTATSKGSAAVPAALLPIYEAASKRTGIPVDVLIAQGKQESDFNPNAVGSAGEIGLHQIKPSTAAAPGYGVAAIDPKTLTDPSVNINFAADYLKAKAGNPNFNDPASVDAALAAYNGGGDKNYVANVRSHMGAS